MSFFKKMLGKKKESELEYESEQNWKDEHEGYERDEQLRVKKAENSEKLREFIEQNRERILKKMSQASDQQNKQSLEQDQKRTGNMGKGTEYGKEWLKKHNEEWGFSDQSSSDYPYTSGYGYPDAKWY